MFMTRSSVNQSHIQHNFDLGKSEATLASHGMRIRMFFRIQRPSEYREQWRS